MDFEKNLKEHYVELTEISAEQKACLPVVQTGKLLFVGDCYPYAHAKLISKGRVGAELSLDQGGQAARHALVYGLSVLRGHLGSLNKIKKIVALDAKIASSSDFYKHQSLLEGASQLLHNIFGKHGAHTQRVAGVQSLPHNASVAISFIVEIR